eukprot:TRINITY_DN11007_c0_g1_i1.p2 TRINITY_DN11007_c0_g1~~TRINITY_DN11007_c0_g1_i1.p2  ORF type:complete len:268 (+),score=55.13 TRINITY_DN11007_c0_g1_i1:713-1516(+)
MLITLSTILVPIRTGFMLSLPLDRDLVATEIELVPFGTLPFGACPLEGEHDCLLGRLPFECASTEDERELGAPGLPLEAETGLSGKVVLKLGGASREKPGISEGFQGLDLTVGELPRDGTEFFKVAGPDLVTEEDRLGGTELPGRVDGVDGRLVGVAGLDEDEDLGADIGRDTGVEDLAEEGVDGLAEGIMDFDEVKMEREVGVDDREGLVVAGRVGRPVGVEGLDAVEPGPPDDEGRRVKPEVVFEIEDMIDCLDIMLLPLEAGSI